MFQSISSATWDSIDVTVTSSATYLVVSNDGGETWFVVSLKHCDGGRRGGGGIMPPGGGWKRQ